MSTVRSIERRLYVRRQQDREFSSQLAVGADVQRRLDWNGIWAGYLTFAGIAILLVSLVFGIGFSSLSPMNSSSWAGAGRGVLIWSAIMIFIATFFGAWVAARAHRAGGGALAKSFTVWCMVVLSVLFSVGWIAGKAIVMTSSAVNGAVSTLGTAGPTALQGVLQNNGVTVTAPQATAIAARIAAGDNAGAATLLAQDAGIANPQAARIIDQASGAATGAAGNVAGNVARGAKAGGSGFSWGMFWLALISLGCALLGGAAGGGGGIRRPGMKPSPQAA